MTDSTPTESASISFKANPVVTDAMVAAAWRAHHIAEWGDDLDPRDNGEGESGPIREALVAALQATPRTADAILSSDWLARVKREAKGEAWDEGARWAYEEITGEPENRFALAPGDNPYREQVK